MMKKWMVLLLTGLLAAASVTGCRKLEPSETPETKAETQAETKAETQAEEKETAAAEAVTENMPEAAEAVTEDTQDAAEAVTENTRDAAEEAATEGTAAAAAVTKGSGKVIVYNWGEYIDPEVLEMFEEETGIKVVYEEFETNEIMYPKVSAGGVAYDVVCPSDYMIDKMIQNDLLSEINWDNVPNISNIGDTYMKWAGEFDPGNK